MFWIVIILMIIAQLIPPVRRRMRAVCRSILAEGVRVICLILVALAISAAALNSQGIPPVSLPGTIMMSLVFWPSGALLLRWLETRNRG